MPHPREVVITGLGVVCPIGIGRGPFWDSLEAGRSGVAEIAEFAGQDVPFRIAGRIRGFEPKEYVQPRKTLKVMSSEIQAAYSAAMLALQDARLEKESVPPERLGIVLGSEMLYGELGELVDAFRHCTVDGVFQHEKWAEHAMKDLFPLWMLKYLPNMAACHIGIACDARGPNNSIVQGGVSSLLAVMEASAAILRGHADVMLTGGSGSSLSLGALSFRGSEHLSQWTGKPEEAPRPFDARRDGIVLGEGSGSLVLEAREHAEARGATILARLVGGSQRFEPEVKNQPRQGTAIAGSLHQALADAKLQPQDIGLVSVAAGGSIAGDALEARIIRETLGNVPVTAIKSYCGDIGAGSGAIELIASVLALVHQRIPSTRNYEQPDPKCPVNVVQGKMPPLEKPAVVVLNQSIAGQAAALVLAGA